MSQETPARATKLVLSGLLALLPVPAWACSCVPDSFQRCTLLPDPGDQQRAVFVGTVQEFYPKDRQQMTQLWDDFYRAHPEWLSRNSSGNRSGRRIVGSPPDDQEFRRELIRFVWGGSLNPTEQEQLRNADQRELDRLMFDYRRRARVQVTEDFSGVGGTEVEVYTNLDGPSCGFDFVEGETYLIEAYRAGPGERWKVSSCLRPRALSEAASDLNALRAWKNGQRLAPNVFGQIFTRDRSQNREGIRVQLLGGRQPLETTVNAAGVFEFLELEPRAYQLQVGVPALRNVSVDLTRAASCVGVMVPLMDLR
jgi:hypothetical protein